MKPKIYSIEASKDNFSYLIKNVKLNGFYSIKCFNLAISNKGGVGYINTLGDPDAFKLSKLNNKNYEKVKLKTLESFCKNNNISKIDLMKMDIEGSEHEVFDKSLNFIKEKIKAFFIEVHILKSENDLDDFKKFLIKNNFSIENDLDKNKLFVKNKNLK